MRAVFMASLITLSPLAAFATEAAKPDPVASALTAATNPALDDLYKRLAAATSEQEADGLVTAIDRALMKSGSDTADLMMSRAVTAMNGNNAPLAIELLSATLRLYPDFTEAWNRRATIFFMEGDYRQSLADVAEVLKREPRHLGALTGMGMMLQQMDDKTNAYAAFKRVVELNPFAENAKKAIEQLKEEVEGTPL